jgi:spore coat protein CotH
MRLAVWLPLLWTFSSGFAAAADNSSTFFDDSKVQEIRLNFSNSDWYTKLSDSYKNNPDNPYFQTKFKYGDTVINSIGARFRGSSSFYDNSSSQKKSFKLHFSEYDPNATFLGMKKLNLNNLDLEPDFIREKLFLDFASKYIVALRAVHCRVYVNDVYWGLYLAVEQPDKIMIQDRYGNDEDGNLYRAADTDADLTYHGTDQSSYYDYYILKTNETANDWSGLVSFIDILNNTATASLPSRIETIADVDNILQGMALNSLFSNVESYGGSASEYLLYQKTGSGRFIFIHRDLNECLGLTI